jgi:hypothetical protein
VGRIAPPLISAGILMKSQFRHDSPPPCRRVLRRRFVSTARRLRIEDGGLARSGNSDLAVARVAEPRVGYTGRMRRRPPDPEYLKLLMPYGEMIQKLALAARTLILEEAPEASELVYEVYTIADHFTFTQRPGDAFVFTTTHANWVNLGFNFGALLPDPSGLLRGEGKWIRHVRIAQASDLDAPGVRELVRAAIAQAERPEGQAGKPRALVRTSQAAKKRAVPSRRRT